MELKDLLKYENVEIIDSVDNWRDAVVIATRKLVEQGYIEPRYTDAIIESAIEHNAYFVLCPGVALLHASSDKGVNETQLSITYVKEPFRFEGKDEDVNLMITLAAADGETHMQAIQQVAIVLGDDETLNKALNPESVDELYSLFTEAQV